MVNDPSYTPPFAYICTNLNLDLFQHYSIYSTKVLREIQNAFFNKYSLSIDHTCYLIPAIEYIYTHNRVIHLPQILLYFLITVIKNRKFISIRTNDLQQCLNAYNHKSQTTISSMRAVLKAMYQYAKLNEYIDRDLTEGLVYEWTNSTEQIHDRYSDEEIKTLWSKLYEINNVDIILIMIYTGLRPTELLEIQTENVHLDEKYMVGGMKNECIPPVYHLRITCI